MSVSRAKLCAVLIGVLPLVALEAGLAGAGYGRERSRAIAAESAAFAAEGGIVRVQPAFRAQLRTAAFRQKPPANALRVAAVGDSVTYGFGLPEVNLDQAYPDVLEQRLSADLPRRRPEVLNCGGVCHSTFQARYIVDEILAYDPAVVLVIVGSSEWMERQLEQYLSRSRGTAPRLRHWRTLSLLRDLSRVLPHRLGWTSLTERLTYEQLPGRTLPVLESDLVHTDEDIDEMLESAARNIEAIVSSCHAAEVPLVLGTQPSNLHSTPFVPSLNDLGEPAGPGPQDAFAMAAQRLEEDDLEEALSHLREASDEIRASGAPTWRQLLSTRAYDLGTAFEEKGDFPRARECFVMAKDHEPLPTRPHSRFNELVRQMAVSSPGVFLADVDRAFETEAPGGIPGEAYFLDDCHPTPLGHEIYAEAIHEALLANSLLEVDGGKAARTPPGADDVL